MSENVVTMVFTDLVSSTAIKKSLKGTNITERNRVYFDTILQPHRHRVEVGLKVCGGRVIKTEGDAYFLVFGNAMRAVQWAIALQNSHHNDPISTPLGLLEVRIGIHTGNPIPDGDDFIGQEVDYAARIASLATGGQILLSEVTAIFVRNNDTTGLSVHHHGIFSLKGIGKVPIYELLYNGKKPQSCRVIHSLNLEKVIPLTSIIVTIIVVGLRFLGVFQGWELKAFDYLLRSRPQIEQSDPRLLIIGITGADVQSQPASERLGTSLSNRTLMKLIEKLNQYQPRAIGLDIYRESPIESQYQPLIKRMKQDNRLIMVCKVGENQENPGISPPPDIPENEILQRVGFSDVITDSDGIIRRQLLGLSPPYESICQSSLSFGLVLTLRYLEDDQIEVKQNDDRSWQIGKVILPLVDHYSAGYNDIDAGGLQLLINYRAAKSIAPQLSLNDALEGDKLTPELVKDRIVLIGNIDESFKDLHLTPYSRNYLPETPGIVVHAHQISQLLSAVKDGRPLIWWWPKWLEIFWIFAWSAIAGILTWCFSSWWKISVGILATVLTIYLICYIVLLQGGWIPLVPSVLVVVLLGSIITLYRSLMKHQK